MATPTPFTYTKGLNKRGGANTFRFENFKQRVANVDVDEAHRVKAAYDFHDLGDSPEACSFKVELDSTMESDVTAPFLALCRKVVPISQTLPQLVHHRAQLVDLLLECLAEPGDAVAWPSVLALLAVLAKDLRSELLPDFQRILTALTERIQPSQPEFTGHVFRTIFFMFKYLSSSLVKRLDDVRGYYGRLLGHVKPYIRQFAAASFAFLLRKVKHEAGLQRHIKSLLRAMSTVGASAAHMGPAAASTRSSKDARFVTRTSGAGIVGIGRPESLKDGTAQLVFEVLKGAQHGLHSKAPLVLSTLFDVCRPKLRAGAAAAAPPPPPASKKKSKKRGRSPTAAPAPPAFTDAATLGLRFEILARVVYIACDHVHDDKASVLWDALLQEVASSCKAFATAPSSAPPEFLASAAVHIARVCSVVQYCVAYRRGVRLSTDTAVHLTGALRLLLQPTVFLAPQQRAGTRRAILRLASAAWHRIPAEAHPVLLSRVFALPAGAAQLPTAGGMYVGVPRGVMGRWGERAGSALPGEAELSPPPHDLLLAFAREVMAGANAGVLVELLPRLFGFLGTVVGDHTAAVWDMVLHAAKVTRAVPGVGEFLSADGKLVLSAGDDSDDEDGMDGGAALSAALLVGLRALPDAVTDGDLDAHWAALQCAGAVVLPLKDVAAALCAFVDASTATVRGVVEARGSSQLPRLWAATVCLMTAADVTPARRKAVLSTVEAAVGAAPPRLHLHLTASDLAPSSDVVATVANVVAALQAGAHVASVAPDGVAFDAVAPWLAPVLAWPVHSAREAALQALTAVPPPAYTGAKASEEDVLSGPCRVLDSCLLVESAVSSMRTERPRVVALESVAVAIRSGRMPDAVLSCVVHHCLGVLYVKYLPLWAPATSCLAAASGLGNGVVLWSALSVQLLHACQAASNPSPSAGVVTLASLLPLVRCDTCTDADEYHKYLLAALASVPGFAASKSRTLVPLFLAFLRDDYYGAAHRRDLDAGNLDVADVVAGLLARPHKQGKGVEAEVKALLAEPPPPRATPMSNKATSIRLASFMAVFQQFKSWGSVFGADALKDVFLRLLLKPDGGIATAALKCLLRYKLPYLTPYREQLERLADDASYRDEMTRFTIGVDGGVIETSHRAEFAVVVTRLCFGRLLQRKGRTKKDSPTLRRAAVLSFLGRLESEELGELVHLALRPFGAVGDLDKVQLLGGIDVGGLVESHVSGYLNLLASMVKLLGWKLHMVLPTLLSVLLTVTHYVCRGATDVGEDVEEEEEEEEEEEDGENDVEESSDEEDAPQVGAGAGAPPPSKKATSSPHLGPRLLRDDGARRALRPLCLGRWRDVFHYYASMSVGEWVDTLLAALSTPLDTLVSTMATAERPSALLRLLECWSQHVELAPLLGRLPSLLPTLLSCVSAGIVVSEQDGRRVATGRGPAQPVVACLFQIVENLLGMDDGIVDVVAGAGTTRRARGPSLQLLLPHVELMLDVFAARLLSRSQSKSDNKAFARRELSILARISQYATGDAMASTARTAVAEQLVALLLPHLRAVRRNHHTSSHREDPKLHVLGVVQRLLPLCRDPRGDVLLLASLLAPGQYAMEGDVRALLLDVLHAASSHALLADFAPCTEVLQGLNARHSSRIGGHDFDAILSGFERLCEPDFLRTAVASRLHLTALGHQVCAHMHDSEFGVRAAARNAATVLLRTAASAAAPLKAAIIPDGSPATIDTSTPAGVALSFVVDVILGDIRVSLQAAAPNVRNAFLSLLSEVVGTFAEFPFPQLYTDLACFRNETDPEADIFAGLTHLQLHRRTRTLQRIAGIVESGALRQATLRDVVLVVTVHTLHDQATPPKETRSKRGGEVANPLAVAGALHDQAVNLIRAVAGQLPWGPYVNLLRRLLRQATTAPILEKVMIRAVCAVIDAFHFDVTGEAEVDEEGAEDEEDDGEEEKTQPAGKSASPLAAEAMVALPQEFRSNPVVVSLITVVLPTLQKLLVKPPTRDDRAGSVRTPVALAHVKVLQLLPPAVMDLELPRVVIRVCQVLKSRIQDERDLARQTLVRMAVALGPAHLGIIVSNLHRVLHSGYAVHVLGYVVNAVLTALAPVLKPPTLPETDFDADTAADDDAKDVEALGEGSAALVDSLPLLITIVMNDALGDTAEERDAEEYRPKTALREARSCRSYDTFQLLAASVPFLPHPAIHTLLAPVVAAFKAEHRLKKAATVVDTLLTRAVSGLVANPSVRVPHLLVYVYGLVSEHLAAKGVAVEAAPEQPAVSTWIVSNPYITGTIGKITSRPDDTFVLPPEPKLTGAARHAPTRAKMRSTAAAASMVWFGVSLLHMGFRRRLVTQASPRHLRMVDSLLPLLVKCLSTAKADRVLAACLRMVPYVVRLPLPGLQQFAPVLTSKSMELLHRTSTSGVKSSVSRTEMSEAAMRAIVATVRNVKSVDVSQTSLRALLVTVQADLNNAARQGATFALLSALVSRRLVVPELYDVMDDVSKLLVRSVHPNARSRCANVFLQFLLHYPLGGARLQQHVEHFVANLAYAYPDGRLAVLEMLHAVAAKFPRGELDKQAQFLFLPLVVRLVADPEPSCRAAVAAVIKLILRNASPPVVDTLADFLRTWLRAEQRDATKQAAAQVVPLLAEAAPLAAAKVLGDVLPALTAELAAGCQALASVEAKIKAYLALTGGDTAWQAVLDDCITGDKVAAEDGGRADVQAVVERAAAIEAGNVEEVVKEEWELEEEGEGEGEGDGGEVDVGLDAGEEEVKDGDVDLEVESGEEGEEEGEGEEGEGEEEEEEDGMVPVPPAHLDLALDELPWKSVYHALVAALGLMQHMGDRVEAAMFDAPVAGLGDGGAMTSVCQLLWYPHVWVRTAASRLLGAFTARRDFGACAAPAGAAPKPKQRRRGRKAQPSGADAATQWAAHPEVLVHLSRRFMGQLISRTLTRELAEVTLPPLVFVARLLVAKQLPAPAPKPAAGDGAGSPAPPTSRLTPLHWLVRQCAAISRRNRPVARHTVLAVCSAMVEGCADAAALAHHLDVLGAMLHKLLSAPTDRPVESGGVTSNVRQAAQDLYAKLERLVGAPTLLRAYNAEQERVTAARIARRRSTALEKVLDPEAAQRRRDKKNRARRRQRQRKIDEARVKKGRGVKRGLV